MNPFVQFGLSPSFELDLAELERAYHDKSRALHPDRFVGQDTATRAQALIASRALNDAYQVLRSPHKRAESLFGLLGGKIGEQERLAPELLMELLEEREALEGDIAAKNLPAIAQRKAAAVVRREDLMTKLAQAFAAHAQGKPTALADIKETLIMLRYVLRFLEACEAGQDGDD